MKQSVLLLWLLLTPGLSFAAKDPNTSKLPSGPGNTGNAETFPNRHVDHLGTGTKLEDPPAGIPTTSAGPAEADPHGSTKTGEFKEFRRTPDIEAE